MIARTSRGHHKNYSIHLLATVEHVNGREPHYEDVAQALSDELEGERISIVLSNDPPQNSNIHITLVDWAEEDDVDYVRDALRRIVDEARQIITASWPMMNNPQPTGQSTITDESIDNARFLLGLQECSECGKWTDPYDDYTPFGCDNPEYPEPFDPSYVCETCWPELKSRIVKGFADGARGGDWHKSRAEQEAAKESRLVWVNSIGKYGTPEWRQYLYVTQEEYDLATDKH